MDLHIWLDSVGVDVAAELLQEKPRTVYSWFRREKAPRIQSANKIVALTFGLVDFGGVYRSLSACNEFKLEAL